MPTTDAIVAIAVGRQDPRKMLRLVGSRDGSFSVSVPYYPAVPGEIAKLRTTDVTGPDGGGMAPLLERHRVTAPVKMSFHAGGFVQFSSVGKRPIRSGRGQFLVPKGMGVHSHPILAPIETGPTFIVACDTLDRLDRLDGSERAPVIQFTDGDFFERDDHRPGWRHTYSIEGFVLAPQHLREARLVGGTMVVVKEYSALRPDWLVPFKIFQLPTTIASIGLVVSVRHVAPPEVLDGYTITGPRDIGSGLMLSGMWRGNPDPVGAPAQELPDLEIGG